MVDIELRDVHVDIGGQRVLAGIDLAVPAGHVLAIVGPSGSGKTTLIRTVAGLQAVAHGQVWLGGRNVTSVEAGGRDVAFVFQDPALLPHRSVARNLSMPLELRGDPVDEIAERVGAEARAMRVSHLLAADPSTLSGGEAQAVQIARAMVKQPAVLLLDEPFARVDPQLAAVLRRELLVIQQGFSVTTLVVTNDPDEPAALADSIAVIDTGRLVQHGSVEEVRSAPATATAALVTGAVDLLTVTVDADTGGVVLRNSAFAVVDDRRWLRAHDGRRVQMLVRPGWWTVRRASADAADGAAAMLERVSWIPGVPSRVHVGGRRLVIDLSAATSDRSLAAGDAVTIAPSRWLLIDPLTGRTLDQP